MKLRDPWLVFAMEIDAYQLLPQWAVLFAARTLPWAELVLGIVLLTGIGLKYAAAAATALMSVFFAIMSWSFLKGMQIDCGCFGPGDKIGPKTLTRDGALLAVCAIVWILATRTTRRFGNRPEPQLRPAVS
jgi:uncharacterized membrane protein YphA (DoxX/SURF4 family)